MPSLQGRYWICTIPHHLFAPFLPAGIQWIRGQLEQGEDTGYLHWQLVLSFATKKTLVYLKSIIGDEAHCELTRSSAAIDYVWKDATRVPNTQFELGTRLLRRNNSNDWESIRQLAISNELASVPPDVYVRYYGSLRRIACDHATPVGMVRTCHVFWGDTGSGKSRRAWDEAGVEAYPKDPRTKWWCGYRGQPNVVIDEFRGDIGVSHLLRWLDRYPVSVETKGSSQPLGALNFWITSNLDPRSWYPDLDEETKSALLRRLTITHFQNFP